MSLRVACRKPCARRERGALLFWSVPHDEAEFSAVVQAAETWVECLDVHLTFTPAVLAEAEAAMAKEVPDIAGMVASRVPRRISAVGGGQGAVALTELAEQLVRIGVPVSARGVAFGLEVFAEAKLVRVIQEASGQRRGGNRTYGRSQGGLDEGPCYNEGITLRERFSGFLSTARGPDGKRPCGCGLPKRRRCLGLVARPSSL